MTELIQKMEQMCSERNLQSVTQLMGRIEPLIRAELDKTLGGSAVWSELCKTGDLVKVKNYYEVTVVGRDNGFMRISIHDHEGTRHPRIVCTPLGQKYLVNCVCRMLNGSTAANESESEKESE